jgi:hypothetical protein
MASSRSLQPGTYLLGAAILRPLGICRSILGCSVTVCFSESSSLNIRASGHAMSIRPSEGSSRSVASLAIDSTKASHSSISFRSFASPRGIFGRSQSPLGKGKYPQTKAIKMPQAHTSLLHVTPRKVFGRCVRRCPGFCEFRVVESRAKVYENGSAVFRRPHDILWRYVVVCRSSGVDEGESIGYLLEDLVSTIAAGQSTSNLCRRSCLNCSQFRIAVSWTMRVRAMTAARQCEAKCLSALCHS